MTFSKKARLNSGARMPIRDAVRERLSDIVDALDEGASLAGIHRTLIAEGCNAGAGPSSFRNALAALHNEMEEIRAKKTISRACQLQATGTPADGSSHLAAAYVDSRNQNQVGRS